jgi:DNA helicase-2/ATP-dependent DNA helicase PcrA
MTPTPVSIRSDEVLDDIEHHFQITAGPGAGKTFWLANHIRVVAQVSKRINPCARIGVISYTNIAVREILRRLGTVGEAADISTIHSFLFRNLVRPYLHLLKMPDGSDLVSHHLIDTHTEHFVAHNHLDAWLGMYGRRQLLIPARKNSLELLKTRLRMLAVRIDNDGNAFFVPCKAEPRDSSIKDLLSPDRLVAYKRQYWLQGSLDHEDVLYFAYRLLQEFPILKSFLSSRFPYLFIDEFQDTLPVQAALVRWLAQEGTIVGVIGDPEQAIYGFLDASASHFHEFKLSGHRSYQILGNQRSTPAIVAFLNQVRSDGLKQEPIRVEPGVPPTIYSGDLADSLKNVRSTSSHSPTMLVLARSHKGVLRARRPDAVLSGDPWDPIETADPNRVRFLQQIAVAVDLAQRQFFDIAIQRLIQGISSRARFREPLQFQGDVHVVSRRSLALSLLEYMLAHHDRMLTRTVLEVYKDLETHVVTCLPGLKLTSAVRGGFVDAASACAYSALIQSVKTTDETRLTRTIHQAKGGEAAAVFVLLDEESADHILKPEAGNEEHRITYVAISRAKEELHIFCSEASRLPEFEALGLKTVQCGKASETAVVKPAPSRKSRKKAT